MKGLSRFEIWLLKKIYRIPYKTPDFEDGPKDDTLNNEDEISWIEKPFQAEPMGDFFGLLLISPTSKAPLEDARRTAFDLSQEPWGFEVAHSQFGRAGLGPLRFGDITALPPIYLTIDENQTITDWETFLPDRAPSYFDTPKKEEGVSDDDYSTLFNEFLHENTLRWSSRLKEMAQIFPRHFVILLDCLNEHGSPITFTHEIRIKT
jgi:hypothetical protein